MAGVFTDNQPDFSHLAPGETKSFSQYWYPIAGTGPAVAATRDVALGVEREEGRTMLRFDATQELGPVELVVRDQQGARTRSLPIELGPDRRAAVVIETAAPIDVELSRDGRTLLTWQGVAAAPDSQPDLEPAREPAAPAKVASVEELYLIGRHLEQYRHATRSPEPYWAEALARDPGHAPTHTALGARRYRQGTLRGRGAAPAQRRRHG